MKHYATPLQRTHLKNNTGKW